MSTNSNEGSAIRDVPVKSLDFLLAEAIRQMEELSRTKDSIDSRATFVIGIPGIILSVFVGVFISFWTSQEIPGLAQTDLFLVLLALLLTIGVVVSLLGAVAVGLSILTPKSFDLGTELVDAYKVAHDPSVDTPALEEGSLRVLISSFTDNLPTYYRNVLRYNIASLLVVVSLTYASEFVGVVISASSVASPVLRIEVNVVVLAVSALVLLVAFHRVWRNWRSTKGRISEERLRLKRLEAFIQNADHSR